MRVLHTSDWHLGRVFHGASLLSEQERALARVVEIAAQAEVDVVVVAGDLYDRAIPPADAVDLLARALRELRGLGAQVVAITGNHDSPNRVGALDPLLRAGGVTLRGRFDPAAPVVVADRAGGPDLVVHPVPYLEPLAARLAPWPGDGRLWGGSTPEAGAGWADPGDAGAPVGATHLPGPPEGPGGRPRRLTQHDVLAHALDAVRADLAGRGAVRSLVVAHAFVAGAAPSDSERELSVGGVDRVPLSVFAGVSYVALGHLHRPQALTDGIAYSGSLLPYSFSETGPVSVRVVDLAADGAVTAEVVELGVERPVATVEGRLDALLADPAHRAVEAAWVRARLTDEVLPRHAMDRLRDRFPHAVVLEHVAPVRAGAADDVRLRSTGVTDLDLVLAFVGDRLGRPADDRETALLVEACDTVAARLREQSPVAAPAAPSGRAPADDDVAGEAVA